MAERIRVQVAGSGVLVTGANRGIGLGFVAEAVARGASKVYAAVRDPDSVEAELTATGATVLGLDVTDPEQVRAAADACPDVSVVVNNAGHFAQDRLIRCTDDDAARAEMEVNYFGVLSMTRAFAPVLAANGGGAFVNVLSVAGMTPVPFMGGYSPAKAAALWLGSIARAELEPDGIQVTSLIVGSVDTRMSAHVEGAKEDPRDIARAGFTAMERGEQTSDTDWMAVEARASVARDPQRYARGLARLLHAESLSTRR